MTFKTLLLAAVSFALCVPVSHVYAQTAQPENAEQTDTQDNKSALAEAQAKALRDTVSSTMKELELDEVQHFAILYSNYTIYSMVGAVRDDVKQAVDKCSENNKDMAGTLQSKFQAWDENVGAALTESKANIDNMGLAQEYLPQSELKTIYGLVDESRAVNSSRFESTPVSTPEACEFMLSKMEETEQNLTHMLRATLISYPEMLKKSQQ